MIRLTKEERRKQILEAAKEVFIKKGYNGSTTLEIAKSAEISEVTLFRYFTSKQEIFLEVIEPILLKSLKEKIKIVKTWSPEKILEYILIERINLVSKNNQILSLILKEKTLIKELGKDDLINKFWFLFKELLIEVNFPKETIEFNTRLLMGFLLSFLYKPEYKKDKIEIYVKQIINLMIK